MVDEFSSPFGGAAAIEGDAVGVVDAVADVAGFAVGVTDVLVLVGSETPFPLAKYCLDKDVSFIPVHSSSEPIKLTELFGVNSSYTAWPSLSRSTYTWLKSGGLSPLMDLTNQQVRFKAGIVIMKHV